MKLWQVCVLVAYLATTCLAEVDRPNVILPNKNVAQQPLQNLMVQNTNNVKAAKKEMIDFAASEFSDDASDDVAENDQSEVALEKEEADYDDNEIETQSLADDDDVADLSGGESAQSDQESMTFDDDSSDQSYDDYDADEDSAASDESDDSDSNFTESGDEEVMSDISNINDYQVTTIIITLKIFLTSSHISSS